MTPRGPVETLKGGPNMAKGTKDRIGVALELLVVLAEADPTAIGSALRRLRGDHAALARLEACLSAQTGASAERATLALGAAIQLAAAELASPAPDPRRRLPELALWLELGW